MIFKLNVLFNIKNCIQMFRAPNCCDTSRNLINWIITHRALSVDGPFFCRRTHEGTHSRRPFTVQSAIKQENFYRMIASRKCGRYRRKEGTIYIGRPIDNIHQLTSKLFVLGEAKNVRVFIKHFWRNPVKSSNYFQPMSRNLQLDILVAVDPDVDKIFCK